MHENFMNTAGYQFGDIIIDLENRQIWRDKKPVTLSPKYFDVLILLVKHPGKLISKNEIFSSVWEDVIVSDTALSQCIKDIRRQLGDQAGQPRYIKTTPKHGYTFIAEVKPLSPDQIKQKQGGKAQLTRTRPYKFLDYFTENDADLFFGREREITEICSKIDAHRSFILHGRSGVGKSSLLRAGIIPRFKDEGKHVFLINSFIDPLADLIKALNSLEGIRTEHDRDQQITQIEISDNVAQVIFFFDQFEDFFLLLPEERRSKFIESLNRLFRNGLQKIKMVFVLREDLLAEMSAFKKALPEIYHHEYRLMRLTREEAVRAIVGPAKKVNYTYESGLVESILDDLSVNNEIDPPQLQIVCDVLFDTAQKSGVLTFADYRNLGGASNILTGYLERVMRRLDSHDLQIAKQILISLISADGRHLFMKVSDIQAKLYQDTAADAAHIRNVIEDLAAARIIRFRFEEGQAWLELAHDFLITEIMRWLNADEIALKRAREVIERAMKNYLGHGLLLDNDALDLILPFGDRLRLSGKECRLIAASLLNRARILPGWVIECTQGIEEIIMNACYDENPEIRQRAAESCLSVKNSSIKTILRELALWDDDLLVRKAASIVLVKHYGTDGTKLLADKSGEKQPGLIRRAISLAFVRDYEKKMIRLSDIPVPIILLVVSGLVWVRLRRDQLSILKEVVGGTTGAAFSGLIVGLFLSLGLIYFRVASPFEVAPVIMVLTGLGTMAGAVGGWGITLGMSAVSHVTYRHSHWWQIFGGAAGGAGVGAFIHLLGVDTLRTLFGQNLSEISGALEGAVIGLSIPLGAALANFGSKRQHAWRKIFGAAFGSMCAAVILIFIEGNLFSGSIEIIARSFSNSQINLDPLATLFGEVHFGELSKIILAGFEGFLFGGFLITGLELIKKHIIKKSRRVMKNNINYSKKEVRRELFSREKSL